ncbi:MAG: biotin transport system substrate-specific component [Chloroflexota bacterium]|nr:biotin transport system substrate-specific component [Chloroflexota bacterium]
MIAARPIALVVLPGSLLWKLVLVLAGSALIALAAQVRIPLPFSPVPVTGQTFAVLLVAAALGRLGLASVIAYLIEGAIGLPVFAGGGFGVATIVGPTGGYLIGFALAAALVGSAVERGWDHHLVTALAAMLLGEVAIYACGLAWLARFALPVPLLDAGLLPFIPGDLVKLALASLALPAAWRLVRR